MPELSATPAAQPISDLRLRRLLRQAFLVPLVVVLLGALALLWQLHQANRTVERIDAAETGVAQAATTERLIIDQETGLRGYQTTGNAVFLSSYNEAERQLNPAFDRMRSTLSGSPAALALLDQLLRSHEGWEQGFAVPLIATVGAGGHTDDVNLNLLGKMQMDAMRHLLASLSATESHRQAAEVARWRSQQRRIGWSLALFAVAISLLIGTHTTAMVRSILDAFRASDAQLRKRAEETLRSEQRLRTTMGSIGEAVITADPQGCVETMNEVASRLMGMTEAQAAGQPLGSVFQVLSPVTRELLPSPFRGVDSGHPEATGDGSDCLLQRPNGTDILIERSGTVLRDAGGAVTGYVLVFRDVTMTRKSQAALLLNEKLAVAGRLASSLAHEIHNPLDAVSNLLFLMDGVSSPEESAQFLELARGEIARVTQISRAMLSLHRESLTPVAVDMREMLQSLLLLLDRRVTSLGLTIVSDLPEGLVIQAFPAQVRQVFTNLLINAAEASPRGGVIHLFAERTTGYHSRGSERAEDGVCVTIEDDGPGIPPATLERLFEPFVTTKGESGTGLGLWISKGIVTRHGGEIVLESSMEDADHGTTVSVFLPDHPRPDRVGA